MSKEIIITGGDAHFFPWMIAAISSLRAHAETSALDLGIIDQGLTDEQRAQLNALGCKIVQPQWTLPVPQEARSLRNIGLVARTALRDYFTGYEVYLWFDADAWMQTPEFVAAYVDGARQRGAAVVTENGPGYRKTFTDLEMVGRQHGGLFRPRRWFALRVRHQHQHRRAVLERHGAALG